MRALSLLLVIIVTLMATAGYGQQFEFCNNFIQNLSFVTGTDRGMEQNLDDNFAWMEQQGYTHLRFFGIYPNGYYAFPSATLEANGYPTHPYFVSILELLVEKANQYGIIVNFDGWEVIAESNYDTTVLGVGFITDEELGLIVQDVLSLGVNLISEEQFGGSYIQTIQSETTQMGATHETTTVLWWQYDWAGLIADQQLGNAFSFYPYDQDEVDSVIGGGFHQSYPANLGLLHVILESARHYSIPTSIAVGSFGTLEMENWKNILLLTQIAHTPDRFSIEEQDTDMLIWDPTFNFMNYAGDEVVAFNEYSLADRPIANLVYDLSTLYNDFFVPSWYASIMNASAIVNTFTSMGYRVVASVDSVIAEADAYFLLLAGGAGSPYVAPLPDYVMPLLDGAKPVFIQPTYGIPDNTDGADWIIFREYFGLPEGETQTLQNSIPQEVVFNVDTVFWGGIELHLTPLMERIITSQVDTSLVDIALSGEVASEDMALLLQRGNKFLINSNLIHLNAYYILSGLLGGPMNAPTLADVTITTDKALIFAEHDTDIDIDLEWTGTAHQFRYNAVGDLIIDGDMEIDTNFYAELTQGELIVLMRSNNYMCGDANSDQDVNVGDAVYIINYVFNSGPAPDPLEAGDANCDGEANVGDAVYLINYIFKGGEEPCCP